MFLFILDSDHEIMDIPVNKRKDEKNKVSTIYYHILSYVNNTVKLPYNEKSHREQKQQNLNYSEIR